MQDIWRTVKGILRDPAMQGIGTFLALLGILLGNSIWFKVIAAILAFSIVVYAFRQKSQKFWLIAGPLMGFILALTLVSVIRFEANGSANQPTIGPVPTNLAANESTIAPDTAQVSPSITPLPSVPETVVESAPLTPTQPSKPFLQRIDFDDPDSDGAKMYGWDCERGQPDPNKATYATVIGYSHFGKVLRITSDDWEPLDFCNIDDKAKQGKFVEIVMWNRDGRGSFYIYVTAITDSGSIPLTVTLIDETGNDGCVGPLCKFIPNLTPMEGGWKRYKIEISDMLTKILRKDVKGFDLNGFRIRPNLDLAYIEITDSNSP